MRIVLRSVEPDELADRIPALLALQARAMGSPPDPSRADIVRQHTGYPGLRGLLAEDDAGELVGFGYGYTTAPGQWWNGQVRAAIGAQRAEQVLDGAFEVAELHVDPRVQGSGVGRRLLHELTLRSDAPRAVLTTGVDNVRARGLYASAGFTVLHDALWAHSGSPGSVVLIADLPLMPALSVVQPPG